MVYSLRGVEQPGSSSGSTHKIFISAIIYESCNGLHKRKLLCENLSNSGKPPAVVIPSQSFAKASDCKQADLVNKLRRPACRSFSVGRCRDLMVGTLIQRSFMRSWTGEEKVQTTLSRSESCSGMHNLKVVGSNPTPATKKICSFKCS